MNMTKYKITAQMIVKAVRDETGPRRLYFNEVVMNYFGNRNELFIEKQRDGCIKISESEEGKAAFICDIDKKQAVTYSKTAAKAFEELFDTSAYEIISVSGWKKTEDGGLIYDPNTVDNISGEDEQDAAEH